MRFVTFHIYAADSVAATPSKSGPSKMAGTPVPPKRAGHEKHAEVSCFCVTVEVFINLF